MNRCAICDITDEENPKANIKFYDISIVKGIQLITRSEPRCLECQETIKENIEEMNIEDEDFPFSI